MKQLERKVTTTYRWWRDEGEINPAHVEALEESAMEQIGEKAKEGYSSGQLLTEIDGVEYTGWWEIKKED